MANLLLVKILFLQQSQDELNGHDATTNVAANIEVNPKNPMEAKLYMTTTIFSPEKNETIGIPKTGDMGSISFPSDDKGYGSVTTVMNLKLEVDKSGNLTLSSTVNTQLSTGNLAVREYKPLINLPFCGAPSVDLKT